MKEADVCCPEHPDGPRSSAGCLPLTWWTWRAYGEGVDDEQREAVLRWRFGGWGGRNASIEYPRFSHRLPRDPLCGDGCCAFIYRVWRGFLDAINCDTVSEQIWSPAVVVVSTVACILYAIIASLGMKPLVVCTKDSSIFCASIATLVRLLFLAVIGITLSILTRAGLNVYAFSWTLLAPVVGCFMYSEEWTTKLASTDLDHAWSNDVVVNYMTMAYFILFTFVGVGYVGLVFQTVLPATLVRRHYNYRYVKELCSNRRGYIVMAGSSDPERKVEYATSDGKSFTDLLAFVQSERDKGHDDDTIADGINRAQQLHDELSKPSSSNGDAMIAADLSESNDLLGSVRHALVPNLSDIANPHAQIKWTFDVNVPGNFWNEYTILPIRIKASMIFTMIITLAICVVVFILEPKLAACYTSMVDGQCRPPSALQPQKLDLYLEAVFSNSTTHHASTVNAPALPELSLASLMPDCDGCNWWQRDFWLFFLASYAAQPFGTYQGVAIVLGPNQTAVEGLAAVAMHRTLGVAHDVVQTFSSVYTVESGLQDYKNGNYAQAMSQFASASASFQAVQSKYETPAQVNKSQAYLRQAYSYAAAAQARLNGTSATAAAAAAAAAQAGLNGTVPAPLPPSLNDVLDPTAFMQGFKAICETAATTLMQDFAMMTSDATELSHSLTTSITTGTVFMIFVSFWSCMAVVQGYRKMVFQAREQKRIHWDRNRFYYTPFWTAQYLMSQMVYHHIPYFACLFAWIFMYTSLAWDGGRTWWAEYVIPTVAGAALSYSICTIGLRMLVWDRFWIVDGSVVSRHWFFAFDLALQMVNVVVVVINVIVRLGLQFVFMLLGLFRIDISCLPEGWESFDSGFTGFVATMYMYEKHAGPIISEFVDCLCHPTVPLRGIQHLRRDIDNGRVEATPERLQKLQAAEAALEKRAAMRRSDGFRDLQATALFTEDDAAALRPFYVARNRWHFAFLLVRNPSLRKYHMMKREQQAGILEVIMSTATTMGDSAMQISTGASTAALQLTRSASFALGMEETPADQKHDNNANTTNNNSPPAEVELKGIQGQAASGKKFNGVLDGV